MNTRPETAVLRPVANLCTSGSCPTIYENGIDEAGSKSVVVQGFVVSADQAGVELPTGEALVRIPAALLAEAVRNLS